MYPDVGLLDDVPIHPEFTLVKVEMVHENTKSLKLEVAPDDMTVTL